MRLFVSDNVFVIIAFFVSALFYQVAVSMNVDMEILIRLDDAFECTRLLFYCAVGNGEIVGNVNFVFLLPCGFIPVKTFNDLELLHYFSVPTISQSSFSLGKTSFLTFWNPSFKICKNVAFLAFASWINASIDKTYIPVI